MEREHAKKPVRRAERPSASPQGEAPAAKKENAGTAPERPEDYSDPICVCEAEPYWQEIAEQLERDSQGKRA
jgi:hypothetical protein